MKKGFKIFALGLAALGIGAVGLAGCGTGETVENVTLADFEEFQNTDGLSNSFTNYTIKYETTYESTAVYIIGDEPYTVPYSTTESIDGHCVISEEDGSLEMTFTYTCTETEGEETTTATYECYLNSEALYINDGTTKIRYLFDEKGDIVITSEYEESDEDYQEDTDEDGEWTWTYESETYYYSCYNTSSLIKACSSVSENIAQIVTALSETFPMTKTTNSDGTTYELVLEDYTDYDEYGGSSTGDASMTVSYDKNNQLTYFFTDSAITYTYVAYENEDGTEETESYDMTELLEISQSAEKLTVPSDIDDYVTYGSTENGSDLTEETAA